MNANVGAGQERLDERFGIEEGDAGDVMGHTAGFQKLLKVGESIRGKWEIRNWKAESGKGERGQGTNDEWRMTNGVRGKKEGCAERGFRGSGG